MTIKYEMKDYKFIPPYLSGHIPLMIIYDDHKDALYVLTRATRVNYSYSVLMKLIFALDKVIQICWYSFLVISSLNN